MESIPGFGGIDIVTSSSALQGVAGILYFFRSLLTFADAFMYVWEYPYGCNEQLSSQILASMPLHDIVEAFGITCNDNFIIVNIVAMPKKSSIRKFITRAFKQIKDRQRKDGSFGMYSSYDS